MDVITEDRDIIATCSAMWFDSTKSAMKKLKVAYNNSLRRLLSLPT